VPIRRIPALLDSPAALVALGVALVLAQVWTFHGVRLDDAYITFRYAQNLASGHGFVFNAGQRVMGSTSPGEVLLAAAVYPIVGRDALPSVMAALGCVGWTAQAALLFVILRKPLGVLCASVVAGAIAVGVAGSPRWLPLETNVAGAAALAAFALALRSRWVGAAAMCAFAGLMRADAYLMVLPLAVLCVREMRWGTWRPALVLGLMAAPWPVFATRYFGSPFPLSISKVDFTTKALYAWHVLRGVPNPHGGPVPFALTAAFWLLVVGGALILIRSDRRLLALVVYGVLHAVFYIVLAPNPAFGWHLHTVTLIAFALVLATAGTLVAKMPGLALRAGAAFAIVAACSWATVEFARSYEMDVWYGARDAEYRKVAAWLSTSADPRDIVAAEEVGTLAYYTGLRMNDYSGLVTKYPGEVFWRLAHRQTTHFRWLVLNEKELELGHHRPYYEGRALGMFAERGWRIFVVDVRSPRIDGLLSPWEE
jgi:hypothetical protein